MSIHTVEQGDSEGWGLVNDVELRVGGDILGIAVRRPFKILSILGR